MASTRNDARLWAQVCGELQAAVVPFDDRQVRARRIVALVRRERAVNGARTFAPGEEIPIEVTRAYDLDGDVWVRQSADPADSLRDSWKMLGYDPDQHEDASAGVWITPWLLDRYGPLTEIRSHGKMRVSPEGGTLAGQLRASLGLPVSYLHPEAPDGS